MPLICLFQATAKTKRQASQSPSPSPSPNRRSRHRSPSPAQSPKVRGRSAFHRESARPVFHRPSSQESDSVISEVADSHHEKIMIADSISLDEPLESESFNKLMSVVLNVCLLSHSICICNLAMKFYCIVLYCVSIFLFHCSRCFTFCFQCRLYLFAFPFTKILHYAEFNVKCKGKFGRFGYFTCLKTVIQFLFCFGLLFVCLFVFCLTSVL